MYSKSFAPGHTNSSAQRNARSVITISKSALSPYSVLNADGIVGLGLLIQVINTHLQKQEVYIHMFKENLFIIIIFFVNIIQQWSTRGWTITRE